MKTSIKSSKLFAFWSVAIIVLLLAASCNEQTIVKSPASQPYEYITASPVGEKVPHSPDKMVHWQWENPKADDELEIYTLKPVSVVSDAPDSFDNLTSLTNKPSSVVVKGTGSIMLDFGQVNAAWLEFDSKDLSGEVTMSISEYNEPAILNKGAQNRIKTKAPIKHGDTYRLELNSELFEGVRFGWIHVNSLEKEWHIDNVRLVSQIKPVNYMGSFSCSDSLFTKIWYTGAYGVKLNLLKDYFGAILMERSDRFSWTGDAYPSQAAALVAFANYDFIKKNLYHTSTQNNGIESYSMYWIQSLVDYYNYTGDAQTIIHFIDNACKKLDHAYDIFGTNPDLRFYGWDERIGAGFFSFSNENDSDLEAQNAYKMLSIESWNDFSRMMNDLGETELSNKYRNYASEKLEEIRKQNDWIEKFGIHAASDAVNTDLLTSQEKNSLYKESFTDRLNRISFSPFNQYFIIQALSEMKKYDLALETIRDNWGGQIDYGATTFFENFRPSWNKELNQNDAPPNGQHGYTSIAHPWGGGVVKWISEEVLGVKPLTPGFATTEILPHLGRTLTWVKGKVPTSSGPIAVEFDLVKGEANVAVPEGITATIGIPKAEKEVVSIKLNGTLVWQNGTNHNSQYQINESNDFILFSEMASGDYEFEVEYQGKTPEFVETEWVYPAAFVGEDSETQGKWESKYGKDGYMLFNYLKEDGKTTHLESFDRDLIDVSLHLNADVQWETGVDKKSVLKPDNKQRFKQNGGAIITRDPLACWQTMKIDIKLSQPTEYEFSLYFLDWDNQSRRSAIEVIDLDTKNIIAPVKIVDNYEGGKYVTYKYNKSIRFRINQVRGPNAAVSGMFFDKIGRLDR